MSLWAVGDGLCPDGAAGYLAGLPALDHVDASALVDPEALRRRLQGQRRPGKHLSLGRKSGEPTLLYAEQPTIICDPHSVSLRSAFPPGNGVDRLDPFSARRLNGYALGALALDPPEPPVPRAHPKRPAGPRLGCDNVRRIRKHRPPPHGLALNVAAGRPVQHPLSPEPKRAICDRKRVDGGLDAARALAVRSHHGPATRVDPNHLLPCGANPQIPRRAPLEPSEPVVREPGAGRRHRLELPPIEANQARVGGRPQVPLRPLREVADRAHRQALLGRPVAVGVGRAAGLLGRRRRAKQRQAHAEQEQQESRGGRRRTPPSDNVCGHWAEHSRRGLGRQIRESMRAPLLLKRVSRMDPSNKKLRQPVRRPQRRAIPRRTITAGTTHSGGLSVEQKRDRGKHGRS